MRDFSIKPYRIALFIPSFAGGGTEKMLLHLAKEFVGQGLEVDLVVTKSEGPYKNNVPKGVRLVDLKSSRMIASLPGLVRYLKRERPEVMLAGSKPVNVLALTSRPLARAPTKVVARQSSILAPKTMNKKYWRDILWRCLARWTYPRADAIVAISKGVADELLQMTNLSKEKVCVIYNPVVTMDIFRKANEPLEHPWFKTDAPPVILGVGRLVAEKDFPTLITAFAMAHQKQSLRLVILGEGKDRAKLESLIKYYELEEDVSLPGFVDNPYKFMKQAEVFVMSSQSEGFGNVLVEPMAVGTKVVSTDCISGPREILENGKYGILVPVGDAESLSNGILKTLSIERDKEALQKRAMDFSASIISEQYLRVLFPGRPESLIVS